MKSLIYKIFPSAILSLLLLLSLTAPVTAQNRSVTGTVTDDKGQPVVNAKIKIIGVDIFRELNCTTNKKGEYSYLLGLQAVSYRIIARKEGFKPEFKENIRPELGEQKTVDFKLTPGEDSKLPFEMTPAELEAYKKQFEEQAKVRAFSAEIKAHFDSGVQLMDQQKYPEAIEEFNKALERDPKQPGILSRIADAYSKTNKNDEALAALEKAIVITPKDGALYTNKGAILSRMGKMAESQEAFKKALEVNPSGSAQSHYNIGITLLNSGETDKAAESFKQAIVADSNYAEAYYQLGMCLSGKNETIPAAIEALQKYVQIGQKPDQKETAKQIIDALKGSK
jgi:tetratricopeptide (TPR) repeat protein